MSRKIPHKQTKRIDADVVVKMEFSKKINQFMVWNETKGVVGHWRCHDSQNEAYDSFEARLTGHVPNNYV